MLKSDLLQVFSARGRVSFSIVLLVREFEKTKKEISEVFNKKQRKRNLALRSVDES